ncbi:hepatitis A virus cellular receptor 1-like [Pelobates cultripes]|uniref:Hepatitis A virus cellular receptor 1-like n=1 Tax=Pelobates cultripes TaxID=61616 RepID=A0AAD1RRR5_PELCU|nr:hepatitis A virus cellular receptor 1-like [Pelobates cultripes]
MHPPCLWISIFTLSFLVPSQETHMTASLGDIVNIPCSYNGTKESTFICWIQDCTSELNCNNMIILSNGQKVIFSQSDRYQLLGTIEQGDMSLTINGLISNDAGTFCCRVQSNKSFRDLQKTHLDIKGKPEYDYDVTDRIPERNQIYNNQFLKMSQVNGSPQKAGTFNSICTVIVPLLMRLQ